MENLHPDQGIASLRLQGKKVRKSPSPPEKLSRKIKSATGADVIVTPKFFVVKNTKKIWI
jgi:hypothetical protein